MRTNFCIHPQHAPELGLSPISVQTPLLSPGPSGAVAPLLRSSHLKPFPAIALDWDHVNLKKRRFRNVQGLLFLFHPRSSLASDSVLYLSLSNNSICSGNTVYKKGPYSVSFPRQSLPNCVAFISLKRAFKLPFFFFFLNNERYASRKLTLIPSQRGSWQLLHGRCVWVKKIISLINHLAVITSVPALCKALEIKESSRRIRHENRISKWWVLKGW